MSPELFCLGSRESLTRVEVHMPQEALAQRNQLLERIAAMHQQRQQAELADADIAEKARTWWQDERLVVRGFFCTKHHRLNAKSRSSV